MLKNINNPKNIMTRRFTRKTVILDFRTRWRFRLGLWLCAFGFHDLSDDFDKRHDETCMSCGCTIINSNLLK